MNTIQILNELQIAHKIKRMAYEIWEKNATETDIYIFGLEEGGAVVAQNLSRHLKTISSLSIHEYALRFDKKRLMLPEDNIPPDIHNQAVVLVDDVANSGKTLLYALMPFLEFHPRKIELVVLVDRKHKNYPINADIVGHTLSTTLQDNIRVTFEKGKLTGAFLE